MIYPQIDTEEALPITKTITGNVSNKRIIYCRKKITAIQRVITYYYFKMTKHC